MSQYSRVLPAQTISVSIPSVILTGNGGNTGIGVDVKTGVVCGVGLWVFGIGVGVKTALRASVVGVFTTIDGSTVGVKTLAGVLVEVEQASTKINRRRPTKGAPFRQEVADEIQPPRWSRKVILNHNPEKVVELPSKKGGLLPLIMP